LGVDRLRGGGKAAQVLGIFVGLAGGVWGAWRELKRALNEEGERDE